MRYPVRAIALMLLMSSAGLFAAEVKPASVTTADAGLVGRWQPGLTAQVRKLPQSQWKNFTSGGLFELLADHQFRVYPNCGREKEEWEKRGLPFGEGKWELIAPNRLRVVVVFKNKTSEKDVEFVLKDGDLIFISPDNENEQFGRFPGEASARCDDR